jgi:hypothetical protein
MHATKLGVSIVFLGLILSGSVVAADNSPGASSNVSPQGTNNAAAASDAIEIQYWQSIQNSNDPADFISYLRKFPNGHFADLALNRLAKLHAPTDVCQSVPGTWSWYNNSDVTFSADGTAVQPGTGFKGTWTCNSGVVKINWPLGIVDTLTPSRNGRHLRGPGGFLGLTTVTGDRK